MTDLMTDLLPPIDTPGDLLICALVALIVAISAGTLLLCIAYAVKLVLTDPLGMLLKAWRFFLHEMKGKMGPSGIINGIGVIATGLAMLVALLCQMGPSIWAKIRGTANEKGIQHFPTFTLAMAGVFLLVFFVSLYVVKTNQDRIQTTARALALTQQPRRERN